MKTLLLAILAALALTFPVHAQSQHGAYVYGEIHYQYKDSHGIRQNGYLYSGLLPSVDMVKAKMYQDAETAAGPTGEIPATFLSDISITYTTGNPNGKMPAHAL